MSDIERGDMVPDKEVVRTKRKAHRFSARRRTTSGVEVLSRLEEKVPAWADHAVAASAAKKAGQLVREMRALKRLTQTDLEARSGVAQPVLSDIERGTGKRGPSFDVLERIAAACGMEICFRERSETVQPQSAEAAPEAMFVAARRDEDAAALLEASAGPRAAGKAAAEAARAAVKWDPSTEVTVCAYPAYFSPKSDEKVTVEARIEHLGTWHDIRIEGSAEAVGFVVASVKDKPFPDPPRPGTRWKTGGYGAHRARPRASRPG